MADYARKVIALLRWFSKCGLGTAVSASSENVLEMRILRPHPDLLNQKRSSNKSSRSLIHASLRATALQKIRRLPKRLNTTKPKNNNCPGCRLKIRVWSQTGKKTKVKYWGKGPL